MYIFTAFKGVSNNVPIIRLLA